MTVFVLTSAFDYEGESPIGVCASVEFAKAWAEKNAKALGYESAEWATVREQLELQCGSTQWVIREEEVQGGAVIDLTKYTDDELTELYNQINLEFLRRAIGPDWTVEPLMYVPPPEPEPPKADEPITYRNNRLKWLRRRLRRLKCK